MVKINYKPWEEIVIHESIQYSLKDFMRIRSLGVPTGGLSAPLLWTEGIVFTQSPMPSTTDVIKEQLQGRIHWSAVEWALMPNYKDFFEIQETRVKIPIVNVSANEILSDVARWLKGSAKLI